MVTLAICVIEIDDVLVAKIVSALHKLSKSLKIFNLSSTFSVAASTTKSLSFTVLLYKLLQNIHEFNHRQLF